MKEDMLEVLIYLFENYVIDGASFEPGQDELAEELAGAGFSGEEIAKAFSWLEGLISVYENDEAYQIGSQASHSVRFLTQQEHQRFGTAGHSLLIRLFNIGLLDQYTQEMVIERVMALDSAKVNLDHIRWVVLLVLSNQPGFGDIAQWAEVMISEDLSPIVH